MGRKPRSRTPEISTETTHDRRGDVPHRAGARPPVDVSCYAYHIVGFAANFTAEYLFRIRKHTRGCVPSPSELGC